ncbi:hypothetical protein FGADI_5790 [Fusarium gaditjirri]|uniref:Uncharacterized protein n=1 Tax=Fusarium gaditjirri TaxID=282569 RepID=A0A8H4T9F1_9HYPO|nr:hypothetical protein FGADI_5790 [Fusarium gaditjirri]
MAESTNAERLDYLLEMALVIHEGIIEILDQNHELDNPLIAHLKEADHFIVVKKALQSHLIQQASENEHELAGGHQSPVAISRANDQSISPQSHRSTAPPTPVGVLLPTHGALELRHLQHEMSTVVSQEKVEIPKLCATCEMQFPMRAGLIIPNDRLR